MTLSLLECTWVATTMRGMLSRSTTTRATVMDLICRLSMSQDTVVIREASIYEHQCSSIIMTTLDTVLGLICRL